MRKLHRFPVSSRVPGCLAQAEVPCSPIGIRQHARACLSGWLLALGSLFLTSGVQAEPVTTANPADIRLLRITLKTPANTARPLPAGESLHDQQEFKLQVLIREAAFLYVVRQRDKVARTLWPSAQQRPAGIRFAPGVSTLPLDDTWLALEPIASGERVCLLASSAVLESIDQVCESPGRGDDQPPPAPPPTRTEQPKPAKPEAPPGDTSKDRGKGNPKAKVILLPVQP